MSKEYIEVLHMLDQPDGSAIMTIDVEPEQVSTFAHTGLRYLLEELQLQEDMIDIPPNTFEKSARTMELTGWQLNILFNFGVISALKRGMESEQNNEEETNKG